MTIRWKKIAPIIIGALLVAGFSFAFEYFNPDLFSGIVCVMPYLNLSIRHKYVEVLQGEE